MLHIHLVSNNVPLSEGKVVKLTQESIHVIVLGFSSAIIIDEDIRDEFYYKIVCTTYHFVLMFIAFSHSFFLLIDITTVSVESQ